MPIGLAIHGPHVFVTEYRNHRIQVFTHGGGASASTSVATAASASAASSSSDPLTSDGSGGGGAMVAAAAAVLSAQAAAAEHPPGVPPQPQPQPQPQQHNAPEQPPHWVEVRGAVAGSREAHVRIIGRADATAGAAPGEFTAPTGVAVAHGRLYVSELVGRRVQVLTLEGAPLQVLGPLCTLPPLMLPRGSSPPLGGPPPPCGCLSPHLASSAGLRDAVLRPPPLRRRRPRLGHRVQGDGRRAAAMAARWRPLRLGARHRRDHLRHDAAQARVKSWVGTLPQAGPGARQPRAGAIP